MSKEPELEHHVIADLAARLAKAERALEEVERVIAPFADAEIDDDAPDVALVSPNVCWITIGHLRAARKWMESRPSPPKEGE